MLQCDAVVQVRNAIKCRYIRAEVSEIHYSIGTGNEEQKREYSVSVIPGSGDNSCTAAYGDSFESCVSQLLQMVQDGKFSGREVDNTQENSQCESTSTPKS